MITGILILCIINTLVSIGVLGYLLRLERERNEYEAAMQASPDTYGGIAPPLRPIIGVCSHGRLAVECPVCVGAGYRGHRH